MLTRISFLAHDTYKTKTIASKIRITLLVGGKREIMRERPTHPPHLHMVGVLSRGRVSSSAMGDMATAKGPRGTAAASRIPFWHD